MTFAHARVSLNNSLILYPTYLASQTNILGKSVSIPNRWSTCLALSLSQRSHTSLKVTPHFFLTVKRSSATFLHSRLGIFIEPKDIPIYTFEHPRGGIFTHLDRWTGLISKKTPHVLQHVSHTILRKKWLKGNLTTVSVLWRYEDKTDFATLLNCTIWRNWA